MGVAETRIYPINTGWLEADLGTYTFWKGPAGEKIWNPVYCFYVDTGEHKVLIDTGLCDEERATRYHHKCQKRGCLEVHEHLEASSACTRTRSRRSSSPTCTGTTCRT